MRAFCDIGHCFQDTLFQTRRTEIFEVRLLHSKLLTARAIIQKSSCQSLGSIYVVSILEIQVLRMHTTLKAYGEILNSTAAISPRPCKV